MGLTLTPVANGMNWTPYAVGGAAARPDSFTGLVPQFASGVYSMVQDAHAAGIPLQITSAYRSPDVQARLYQNALKKYGSEKAARKWVAPPGRSQHNFGTAVDFAMNGSLIRDANSPAAQWIKANAAKYGLDVPMSWEPWQVELAGARGKAPAKRVSQTVQSAQSGQNVQNRPQGIFSTQSSQQEVPQMQPQNATGLLGALFPNMTADRQDRLAMALSGLSMHPNQGVMQAAAQGMADRRTDRREAQAQAQQRQQTNRTVEYLATTMGRPDLAQAVAQGVMSGSDAYKVATQGAEPVKGIPINGQLVNPVTGEQMGDYRTQEGPGTTKYAWNKDLGVYVDPTNPQAGGVTVPGATTAPEIDVKGEGDLRKEYTGRQDVKSFKQQADAFTRIRAAAEQPDAAGDLALIFNYMKLLDPGSVVRESEFATAQNAAGVDDRTRNVWNRLKSGERLAPEQRQEFVARAGRIYESARAQNSSTESQYRDIAQQYGYNVDRAVPDVNYQSPYAPQSSPAPSARPAAPQSAMAAPTKEQIRGALQQLSPYDLELLGSIPNPRAQVQFLRDKGLLP